MICERRRLLGGCSCATTGECMHARMGRAQAGQARPSTAAPEAASLPASLPHSRTMAVNPRLSLLAGLHSRGMGMGPQGGAFPNRPGDI